MIRETMPIPRSSGASMRAVAGCGHSVVLLWRYCGCGEIMHSRCDGDAIGVLPATRSLPVNSVGDGR